MFCFNSSKVVIVIEGVGIVVEADVCRLQLCCSIISDELVEKGMVGVGAGMGVGVGMEVGIEVGIEVGMGTGVGMGAGAEVPEKKEVK